MSRSRSADEVGSATPTRRRDAEIGALGRSRARVVSAMMVVRLLYAQCHDAQAAVDAERQVIVASDLTDRQNDHEHLGPLVEQIERVAAEWTSLCTAHNRLRLAAANT